MATSLCPQGCPIHPAFGHCGNCVDAPHQGDHPAATVAVGDGTSGTRWQALLGDRFVGAAMWQPCTSRTPQNDSIA